MSVKMTRFLGDTPFRVFIRLVVLSFIVGLVLATLEIHPFEIFSWLERLVRRIWEMGFEAIERGFGYLVLGALIVVPAFLIMRVIKIGGRGRRTGSE
ncbi:MAG TPA: DUF6460 domain-containing protein [Afifellaceae bacterium]|nr:DUF6460 domain-containing protein [Afifellaceae bacterium]